MGWMPGYFTGNEEFHDVGILSSQRGGADSQPVNEFRENMIECANDVWEL